MIRNLVLMVVLVLVTSVRAYAGALFEMQHIKMQRAKQAQMQQLAQEQAYMQSQSEGVPGAQPAPVQPTYQQQIDQRNQAIAQAILNAHGASVTGVVPAASSSSTGPVSPAPAPDAGHGSQVQDVVDLADVWKKLDNKSTVWPLLMDDQAKVLTISEYISRFERQGVKIKLPPEHYAQMVDEVSGQNPQMLQRPFGEVLQVLAIVDYDFDNGMDKDLLARKVLGDDGFEKNKQRLSQQQTDQGARGRP